MGWNDATPRDGFARLAGTTAHHASTIYEAGCNADRPPWSRCPEVSGSCPPRRECRWKTRGPLSGTLTSALPWNWPPVFAPKTAQQNMRRRCHLSRDRLFTPNCTNGRLAGCGSPHTMTEPVPRFPPCRKTWRCSAASATAARRRIWRAPEKPLIGPHKLCVCLYGKVADRLKATHLSALYGRPYRRFESFPSPHAHCWTAHGAPDPSEKKGSARAEPKSGRNRLRERR
jgi:hypothetical protein